MKDKAIIQFPNKRKPAQLQPQWECMIQYGTTGEGAERYVIVTCPECAEVDEFYPKIDGPHRIERCSYTDCGVQYPFSILIGFSTELHVSVGQLDERKTESKQDAPTNTIKAPTTSI